MTNLMDLLVLPCIQATGISMWLIAGTTASRFTAAVGPTRPPWGQPGCQAPATAILIPQWE